MQTILLISPYWKEPHRWMVSSVKLAELWQRLGFRVIVVCMGSESGVEKVSETLTIHRRKDLFLPDPWNYGIAFGFTDYVKKIIKDEKPDHIVVNKVLFWTSLSTILLRLSGHKVILLTDALVGMTWFPRGTIPQIASRIYAWTFGLWILRSAHRFVTFHPQSEKLLKTLGIARKTEVIPTGIDVSRYSFTRLSLEQSQTRNEKRTNEQTNVTVTYIGRLESVKGVDDFLAALVPLKKEFSELHLKVVGWFKEGHSLVKEYSHSVEFTGLRDDIPEQLAGTDIFVLPSYSEGLSNALMEAMASNCACIASDVGGNRYLIQNGVSGFLFPAGDREALASHVRRLLKDPAKREAMGTAARKRIEEQFDWSVVGNLYKSLFESLS